MALAQGDIIEYIDFGLNPTGREPAYRRPAVVVSSDYFNMSSSMTIVCPVTSSDNRYPLHLELPTGIAVHGWIVCEQVRAVDVIAREARVIDHLDADSETMRAVLECIRSFF